MHLRARVAVRGLRDTTPRSSAGRPRRWRHDRGLPPGIAPRNHIFRGLRNPGSASTTWQSATSRSAEQQRGASHPLSRELDALPQRALARELIELHQSRRGCCHLRRASRVPIARGATGTRLGPAVVRPRLRIPRISRLSARPAGCSPEGECRFISRGRPGGARAPPPNCSGDGPRHGRDLARREVEAVCLLAARRAV